MKKKKLKILIFLLFLPSTLLLGKVFLDLGIINSSLTANLNNFDQKNSINLFLVGDIMLDRGVEYEIRKKGDWNWPFLKIKEDLEKADILFGNLESQISDKGYKIGSIYSFRADPEAIYPLQYAGFDILSLTNNHSLDYTRSALEDSMRRLDKAGIEYVGAGLNREEAFSFKIIKKKGVKIAFLAYSNFGSENYKAKENKSGIAYIDQNNLYRIEDDIKKAKKAADIVVVSIHAGVEYESIPSSSQKEFSKKAIENGADIVAGHHPHVIQPYEKYKDGWIFYSLGNFLFDQSFSRETSLAQLAKIKIENKKIKEVNAETYLINKSFQLEKIK